MQQHVLDKLDSRSLSIIHDFCEAARAAGRVNNEVLDEETRQVLTDVQALNDLDLISLRVAVAAGNIPEVQSKLVWIGTKLDRQRRELINLFDDDSE